MSTATTTSIAAIVKALFDEKGEKGVQERLQAEIARTKKAEAEIANYRKKADAAKRENTRLQDNLSRITSQKTALESSLRHAMTDYEGAKKQRDDAIEAMANERTRIRLRTLEEVTNVNLKLAEEERLADEMTKENATLQAEFDEKRAGVDALMTELQSECKVRDAEARLLQEKISATRLEKDQLMTEKLGLLQNIALLREKKAQLATQSELYATKVVEFAQSVTDSEKVVTLGAERTKQLEDRLAAVEKEKVAAAEEKRKADADVAKMRQLVAGLKKTILHLEKIKALTEQKCRDAQKKQLATKAAAAAPAAAAAA